MYILLRKFLVLSALCFPMLANGLYVNDRVMGGNEGNEGLSYKLPAGWVASSYLSEDEKKRLAVFFPTQHSDGWTDRVKVHAFAKREGWRESASRFIMSQFEMGCEPERYKTLLSPNYESYSCVSRVLFHYISCRYIEGDTLAFVLLYSIATDKEYKRVMDDLSKWLAMSKVLASFSVCRAGETSSECQNTTSFLRFSPFLCNREAGFNPSGMMGILATPEFPSKMRPVL